MEDFQETQAVNGEQHLQDLRQRINAKAENLVKYRCTERRTKRWAGIAIMTVLLAIIVALAVYSYVKNDLGAFSTWVCIFIGAALIADYILKMIMRRYLTRMKNPSTAPQYYREVKRLITTHKLRQWIPLAAALICGGFVRYGSGTWIDTCLASGGLVLGSILGAKMRNWFLDDDFCYDVEELGDMIAQESAE
jgi:hypothetical protein